MTNAADPSLLINILGKTGTDMTARLPLPELPPGWSLHQVLGAGAHGTSCWYGAMSGAQGTEELGSREAAVAQCWAQFLSSANADLSPEWRAYFDAARKAATPCGVTFVKAVVR
jgi:hypothetical protein